VGIKTEKRTRAKYKGLRQAHGDYSYSVHGPVIWNSLPHDLQLTDMLLAVFRDRLKTFLFDGDAYYNVANANLGFVSYYLRQLGYVLAGVCLSVFLFLSLQLHVNY